MAYSKSFFYILWYFIYFIPLGFMVPQMGPFVYNHLTKIEPGYLFFTSQIAMTAGAIFAGFFYDFAKKFKSLLFIKIFTMGFCLWLLQKELSHFWVLFIYFWLYFSGGGVHPLISSGYFQSGLAESGFARARGFGTLSFFLVNFILIFFPFDSAKMVFWASLLFFLALPSVLLLPKVEGFPSSEFSQKKFFLGKNLFLSKHYLAFWGICIWYNFQFITTETVLSEYVSRLEINFLGIHFNPLAFSWALATFTETLFFMWASLQKKYSGIAFINLAFLAGLLRYGVLYFFRNPWVELFAQALHGIHFGAFYLGSILYIKEKTNPKLLATTTAVSQLLSRAVGGGLGGYIFGQMGLISMDLVFFVNGVFAFLGIVLLYFFKRHFAQRPNF